MQEVPWFIDFAFPYPAACTPAELLVILRRLAADWPGWPHFPWRVTRHIHLFLGRPPVNFHYLMIHRCLMGYAAHLILTLDFDSRDDVLAVMIRERFEIVGMLRVLLVDALRYEMRFTKRDYILDCTGHDEGHENVTPEEVARRRQAFQECFEDGVREFKKIMGMSSQLDNMDEWSMGRRLRTWAAAGDLPDKVTLTVRMEETAVGKVIMPCKAEAAAMEGAGKKVPRLLVERAKGKCGMRNAERGEMSSGGRAVGRSDGGISEVGGPRSDVSPVGTGQRPSREGGGPKAEGGTEVSVVGAALTLAGALDGNPRVKAPNHMTVLKMFCLDALSIGAIARKCRCTKGTVFNRKVALERRLGQRLEVFRRMSGVFDQVEKALGDGRAKAVYRRGLVERSS